MRHGDFTRLADNYARYRPGYAPFVLEAFLGLCPVSPIGADVGAGTGIWTRQMAARGARMVAVEPNEAMRNAGREAATDTAQGIEWREGSAEDTGLPAGHFDFVSMASSFHWPDFTKAVAEFRRILKPGGLFMALWNTRRYESNPLLVAIEEHLHAIVPELKRVSSGRSAFCDGLTEQLRCCGAFSEVLYLEGSHTEQQSPERYLGLWESVNDVRVQAGEERFAAFLDFIREKTDGLDAIEAEYTTRAWIARRKD